MFQSHLREIMLPEPSTRRPSLKPFKPSLLRYGAGLITGMLFFSPSLCGSDMSSNPSRLSVPSQSFHILKRRRDLNSILPVRDIINKESSMRWGTSVVGPVVWIFYLKTGLSPGLQRPLGCVWSWGVLPLCSSRAWSDYVAQYRGKTLLWRLLRLDDIYIAFVHQKALSLPF